jgi:hypothetical protein
MFKVSYYHHASGDRYRVSRAFDTIELAQEFIHVNALVCALPGVLLIAVGSTNPDSAWCQDHGHTGFMPGSVCPLCDALAAAGAIADPFARVAS